MNEQQWVQHYISPRQHPENAVYGPGDDAALIQPPENSSLVVSVDALVSGQHFTFDGLQSWCPPEILARRLVRGSVSDLSAMGAKASGLILSVETPELPGFLGEDFWRGLDAEIERLQIRLMGGNVARNPNSLSLHATVLGAVEEARCWRRDRAQLGDRIGVTGSPGSAAKALEHLNQGLTYESPDPWRSPACRQNFVAELAPAMNRPPTAIDISDGLALDLHRVCMASQLSAQVELESLVSSASSPDLKQVLGGGEDYELLLGIDPAESDKVEAIAQESGTEWHWIGEFIPTTDQGPVLEATLKGTPVDIPSTGAATPGWDPFNNA